MRPHLVAPPHGGTHCDVPYHARTHGGSVTCHTMPARHSAHLCIHAPRLACQHGSPRRGGFAWHWCDLQQITYDMKTERKCTFHQAAAGGTRARLGLGQPQSVIGAVAAVREYTRYCVQVGSHRWCSVWTRSSNSSPRHVTVHKRRCDQSMSLRRGSHWPSGMAVVVRLRPRMDGHAQVRCMSGTATSPSLSM